MVGMFLAWRREVGLWKGSKVSPHGLALILCPLSCGSWCPLWRCRIFVGTWCITHHMYVLYHTHHQLCFSLIALFRLGVGCSVAVFLDVIMVIGSSEGGCGIKCGLLGKVSPGPAEVHWSSRGWTEAVCLQFSAGQGRPHPYTSLEVSVLCGLFACCLWGGTQKISH